MRVGESQCMSADAAKRSTTAGSDAVCKCCQTIRYDMNMFTDTLGLAARTALHRLEAVC